jgi:uncharacterized protein YdeI (YjbR/CyaY-like superfamily)
VTEPVGGTREAPRFLASAEELRAWLTAHAADAGELWLGFHKRGTGVASPTWPEAVDEALCVGWIDGVRHRIDDSRYGIRFTPRKRGSTWSAVNVARVEELERAGRMRPAGREAFAARRVDRTAIYAYENRPAELPDELAERFRAEPEAWAFFTAQAPWYRRTATYWVVSAKRAETRERRLALLIEDSAAGRRLDRLSPGRRAAG